MAVRRMTAARHTAALGIALGLGATLLVGCAASDGDDGTTAPSATEVEPTPDATPTEAPPYDGTAAPEKPADMASDSHLGARAAATYFLDARNWALISNDAAALVAICDPASAFCASSIETVRANAAESSSIHGGRSTFTIGSVLPPTTDSAFFEVLGTIDEEPMTKTSASGEVLFTTEGQQGVPFVVFAEYQATSGWIIRGADVDTR